MRIKTIVCALLIAGLAHAQSLAPGAGKLYAVIFDVTVDSTGVIETLKVAKVIDPSSGSTDAVDVAVPAKYLSAARAYLKKRNYRTDSRHFNTWLFYDPNRPDRADIDPKSGRP